MKFNLNKSLEILSRTPDVLNTLLTGLSDDWVIHNEGGETWSPYNIVGHLIHGEREDWIARTRKILGIETDKNFVPFDRFAQFNENKKKTLQELLDEFKARRKKNIKILASFNIDDKKLKMEGTHPEFGIVTLEQLLSTWTAHDLTHIAQISRIMAKQYKEAMGPWIEYFRVLKDTGHAPNFKQEDE
jgi:hypothetical protein